MHLLLWVFLVGFQSAHSVEYTLCTNVSTIMLFRDSSELGQWGLKSSGVMNTTRLALQQILASSSRNGALADSRVATKLAHFKNRLETGEDIVNISSGDREGAVCRLRY